MVLFLQLAAEKRHHFWCSSNKYLALLKGCLYSNFLNIWLNLSKYISVVFRTVPLTWISRNSIFFKSQNPHTSVLIGSIRVATACCCCFLLELLVVVTSEVTGASATGATADAATAPAAASSAGLVAAVVCVILASVSFFFRSRSFSRTTCDWRLALDTV